MATTQEIQNWLAANPGASDATIVAAMNQYGVTPAQMAAATGLSQAAVQQRYDAVTGPVQPAAPQPTASVAKSSGPIQLTQDQLGSMQADTDEYGNVVGYYGKVNIGGQDVWATTDETGKLQHAAGAADGNMSDLRTVTLLNQYDSNMNKTGTSVYNPNPSSNFLQDISPILGIAAAAMGVPGIIGSAMGLSGAAAAAAGGAVLGGGTAALSGGNIAQGALTGGALGYLGASDTSQPITTNGLDMSSAAAYDQGLTGVGSNVGTAGSTAFNPDYSLSSGGTNLSSMGGAQGLTSGGTNLDYMGGGQGLNTSGVSNLADMGGAQGITYTNPATGQVSNAAGGTTDYTGLGGTNLGTTTTTPSTLGSTLAGVDTGVGTAAGTAATAAGGAGTGVLGTNLSAAQLAALGSAAASGIGGVVTGNAISNANATQQAAGQQAGQTLKDIYNQQLGFVQPYQAAGQQGLNQISANMPYLTHQFNAADLAAGLAPNYDFMLQQGQMANQRAANVGGGALSGNTLQGLQKYTQDYAGNAYQNAFQNYQNQRTNIYNTLSNIAGLGSTANAQAIGAGTNYGQQQTGLTTGLAAANAAATVGQGQNVSNTLGNVMNNITLASLLNQKPSVVPTT
jgi:hypothetical protein